MGAAWQREGFLHPENEGGWVRVEAVHGEALSFGAVFAAVLSATERAPAIPKRQGKVWKREMTRI